MDHLVERVVEVLPVTSTGVTLISPAMAPRYVAASDQSAMRFERLKTEIGQGPCLVAYKSGEAVVIPDLGRDRRFPQFAPAALADVAAAYLLIAQSRDEARAISDRFHHNALHDPLTGLPNRLLLRERLERAAERRKRTHTNAAILFVDLDGFKQSTTRTVTRSATSC